MPSLRKVHATQPPPAAAAAAAAAAAEKRKHDAPDTLEAPFVPAQVQENHSSTITNPAKASAEEARAKKKAKRSQDNGTAKKPKKRDPNAPKCPKTAYNHYQAYLHPLLKEENPRLTWSEMSSIIGNRWKQLSNDEKRPYEDMYAENKKLYDVELSEYERKHKSMGNGIHLPRNTALLKAEKTVDSTTNAVTGVDEQRQSTETNNLFGLQKKYSATKVKKEKAASKIEESRRVTSDSMRSDAILRDLETLRNDSAKTTENQNDPKMMNDEMIMAPDDDSINDILNAGFTSGNVKSKPDYDGSVSVAGVQKDNGGEAVDGVLGKQLCTKLPSESKEKNESDEMLRDGAEGLGLLDEVSELKDDGANKSGSNEILMKASTEKQGDASVELGHNNNFRVDDEGIEPSANLDSTSSRDSNKMQDDDSIGSKSLLSSNEAKYHPTVDKEEVLTPLSPQKPRKIHKESLEVVRFDGKENTSPIIASHGVKVSNTPVQDEKQVVFNLVPLTPNNCRTLLKRKNPNFVDVLQVPDNHDLYNRKTITLSCKNELDLARNSTTGIKSDLISRKLCTVTCSSSGDDKEPTASVLVHKPAKSHAVYVDGQIIAESQTVIRNKSILSLYGAVGYAYEVQLSYM